MSDDNQYSVFHSGPERYFALRRAATASFIGNFIEWFDYASYGYLAAVIGGKDGGGGTPPLSGSLFSCGRSMQSHSHTARRPYGTSRLSLPNDE